MPPQLTMPRYGWLPDIKYVQIQTHSRCNADCWFCPYVESEHAANHGRMTDETWDTIMHNLNQFPNINSVGKICPYLMQEPLIDKTIFAKIESIYSWFPKTCVEISTNGAALTEKTIDRLFELFSGKRHDLWVSHHGIDQESLQYIMQIDYETAMSNLLLLLKKSDGRFTIKIRGAGESADGKHVKFTRQQYLDHWQKIFRDNNINTRNVSVDAFKFHDRAGTLHRTERDANLLNMGTVRDIGPGRPPFHCPRLDEWIHFMYDGTIRLCCMDYHGEVKLPNINKTSLLEYFHGPDYRNLIEQVSGRTESPANFICKRCTSPGG